MSTGSGFFGEEPGARHSQGGRPEDDGTFADVLNGFTLNSGRSRRKRKKDKDTHAEPVPAPPPETPDDRGEPMTPPPAPVAEAPSPAAALFEPGAASVVQPRYPEPEPVSPAEETAVVRPYALTGGRTKSNYALELETLVSVKDRPNGQNAVETPEQVEHRSILEECRTPRSVAEIVSALRVPLGVARVLISDAADAGLVTVHRTISGDDGAEAHLMLMERVLSGLRRL
ncbi:DUF742 domain-containing protein [Amycolatopsis sp. CA-230715]|uniref:DUF742 domain-containing protein n=1 Tax=Amycolatopsis sp. CA-230715 TaxID=2745196 RepID=UPI001C00C41E|nr:DUF742 domain-containing protein [Amycolatopsis sp. CA-230715]QWF77493.1 hypothetical protein HUW46_00885 [Amycolatopsis sp. CA-230715]